MKKCPYCAEQIQDEAVKCRFCGEFLQAVGSVAPARTSAPLPSPRRSSGPKEPVEFNTLMGCLVPVCLFFLIAFAAPQMNMDLSYAWWIITAPLVLAFIKYLIDLYLAEQ